MDGISIIIPTRNEADNIDPLLRRILDVQLPNEISPEIIFVDDSSSDDTRENVLKWSADPPEIKLVCRDSGGGLASAVIIGARHAAHDIVVVMDADLSHPPERIPEMVTPILENTADMVIGSRYVHGGATPEWPASRKIASKLATIPARMFTDVHDPLAGFFAISRDKLCNLRPDVPGFKIGLEALAVYGTDLRVSEIPIVFNDRFEGYSKMNKRIIFEYLKQVVQLSRFASDSFTPARLAGLGFMGLIVNVLLFLGGIGSGLSMVNSHVMGAVGMTVVLFPCMYFIWKRGGKERRLEITHLLAGLGAFLYSTCVQGGMFLVSYDWFGFAQLPAFIFAGAVGVSSFIGLLSIYCFSGIRELSNTIRLRFGAFGVITLLLTLRLVYLGVPELMEQEAYYWNYAQHLDLSYLDHPPMVAILVWLGTLVFGITEFGVRIGAFLSWFITAFFLYRLSRYLVGRSAALGAVALLSALPLYFGTGLIMTPDAPLHAAWAALLYFLYLTLVEKNSEAWLGVGISLGFGMLSKYTIVLLGPGVILFMLIDRRARGWFVRSEPWGAALIALLIFSPVLIWNFQHDWASFLFQGEQRVTGRTFFTTDRLLGYITMILTPAGILTTLYFLFKGNRVLLEHTRDIGGRLFNLLDRRYLFILLMLVSPLGVFFMFSLTKEVKLNWTSPLWLAILPFLGAVALASLSGLKSRFLSFLLEFWKVTVVVLLLGFSIGLHYVSFGLPGVPHPPGPFLIGWDGVAREVEKTVDEYEAMTGRRPIVVGMDPYQITSGLAFYRTKNARAENPERRRRGIDETVGWHLFGWNSLMYRYWAEPADFIGRDILAIGSNDVRVEYPYFQNRILGMNNIHPLDAKRDGQPVRRFYARLLKGYRDVVE
jgi:dolichol-phosphate mannosyltransferase